jgi:hypothetical protein
MYEVVLVFFLPYFVISFVACDYYAGVGTRIRTRRSSQGGETVIGRRMAAVIRLGLKVLKKITMTEVEMTDDG